MKTLFLHMGSKCNFSCAHCITNSSPNNESFEIKSEDLPAVVTFIKKEKQIETIHFVGGEPSLFLGRIEEIQTKLESQFTEHKFSYAMTTNGWWWKNPSAVTTRVKLNKVHVSFDRFRGPYVTKAHIFKLMNALREQSIEVSVNVAFSEVGELLAVQDFAEAGFKIVPLTVGSGGRATREIAFQGYDANVLEKQCPNSREGTSPAIGYFSSHGFSICCGPLFHDGDANQKAEICTETGEPSNIEKLMGKKSFGQLYFESGYDVTGLKFSSECEVCALFYQRRFGLPSLFDLSQGTGFGNQETESFPDQNYLLLAEQKAAIRFRLYLPGELKADEDFLLSNSEIAEPLIFAERCSSDLSSEEKIQVAELCIDFVLKKNSSRVSKKSSEELKKEMETALLNNSWKMLRVFQKEAIIGQTIVREINHHPNLKRSVLHVSFIGIDPEVSDKSIRNSIRYSMIKWIKNQQTNNIPISASVNSFNDASLNFFLNRLGFKINSINYSRVIK